MRPTIIPQKLDDLKWKLTRWKYLQWLPSTSITLAPKSYPHFSIIAIVSALPIVSIHFSAPCIYVNCIVYRPALDGAGNAILLSTRPFVWVKINLIIMIIMGLATGPFVISHLPPFPRRNTSSRARNCLRGEPASPMACTEEASKPASKIHRTKFIFTFSTLLFTVSEMLPPLHTAVAGGNQMSETAQNSHLK